MAWPKKGTRHITVNGTRYAWRVSGEDGCITLRVRPETPEAPSLEAYASYLETWIPRADGGAFSAGDQIVITNRLVRRTILHAIEKCGYDPARKASPLIIQHLERKIDVSDAIRAQRS